MDSLADFEKHLAEERQARKKKHHGDHRDGTSGHRKHRHHHHHHHHKQADDHSRQRSRDTHERDGDSHRSKRAKYLEDEEEVESRKRTNGMPSRPGKDQIINPDDKSHTSDVAQLKRDAWMVAPSAIDFDYIQTRTKKLAKAPVTKSDCNLKSHKNELNPYLRVREANDKAPDDNQAPANEITYTFGDAGSQWRMTRLKAVYNQAEQGSKYLDEVAFKMYGDLKLFDDAREEYNDLERRKVYGDGYVGKHKPTGELYRQRKIEISVEQPASTSVIGTTPANSELSSQAVLDSTSLNRMKAQLMKAKLKNSPESARLQKEYDEALLKYTEKCSKPETVVLGHMESRMLAGSRSEVKPIDNKKGRERGLVESNEAMSIEDMVREERRTKGQAGGEGMRAAERIAKDARFETDIDYMEENANKLAQRVQKSEINLKRMAVSEYEKMNRILDNCQLCHHEDKNQPPVAPIISLATRVFLTLPTEPELSEGGAVIVPFQHRLNLLECDDDEWEEIRNFMKSLTRMYHDQGRDVLFYENAADLHRKKHAALQVVPLPYSLGEIAPAFFKEAILSSDEEWAQHKKLFDTAADARKGLGKYAFRRKFSKEMPYFHVWFDINGGLGHIVEDTRRWPRGDLFAREVIGGMLDIDSEVIRKQGHWNRNDKRLPAFKARWRKFDWTRVLTDV